MITKEFKIKGMHCSSCEILIKDALEETGKIKKVNVSHAKGNATVTFDEKKITEKEIITIIKKEGYEAK